MTPTLLERKPWWSTLQLIWAPWRLGYVAASVSPFMAWVAGVATGVSLFSAMLLYVGVAIAEPWGTWASLARDYVSTLPLIAVPWTVIVGAALLLSSPFVLRLREGHPVKKATFNTFVLSPLGIVLPFTAWYVAFSMTTLASDIMNDTSLDWLVLSAPMACAGSCAWPFFLGLTSFIPVTYALVQIQDEWAPRAAYICVRCCYDLRASREAGSTACPECGEPIST